MTCPLSVLFRLFERGLSVGLLLVAGMSDRDDDPLASPIGASVARWHNPPPRQLTA